MAGFFVWTIALLIAGTFAPCTAEIDSWPVFSCHPFNNTAVHRNAVKFRTMDWTSCRETHEKYKGRCNKVCVLVNTFVLTKTKKDGPVIATDTFLKEFRYELGYKENDSLPANVQEIVERIRSKLEACKTKYAEFARLNLKEHSCDPWSNLTTCIDEAVGC